MKIVRLIRHAESATNAGLSDPTPLVSSIDSCDRFITGQREISACHTI